MGYSKSLFNGQLGTSHLLASFRGEVHDSVGTTELVFHRDLEVKCIVSLRGLFKRCPLKHIVLTDHFSHDVTLFMTSSSVIMYRQ